MAAKGTAKEALKVVMFLGSARENRLCTRVYKFVHEQLVKTGHDVTVLGKVLRLFGSNGDDPVSLAVY